MVSVGLFGPGKMGAPMASRLLDAGFDVTIWARRVLSAADLAGKGAHVTTRPSELAACDLMISMLQNLDQLKPLLDGDDGLVAAVEKPLILVISSTVAPRDVRDLAADLEARSDLIRVMDAPVSGGQAGAQAGTLSIMMGGDRAVTSQAEPVLKACGTPVHCGDLGAGEVVKACNQMVVGVTMAALCEAAILAESAGVDVALMYRMLAQGWGASAVLDAKHTKIEQRDYSVTGASTFMVKDLHIALSEATPGSLPTTEHALSLYQGVDDAGLGDQDLCVIHHYLSKRAR